MLTVSRYLDFANELIAKYQGAGGAFGEIAMIHPQAENTVEAEPVQISQNLITNIYRIQNIREENYLYNKNLTFLTTLFEKRFYQNIYPSMEKQVEKVVREEFYNAEKHTIEQFAKMLQKYVEREGAEKLTVLKEHLLKENHYKETKLLKEQEVLFRKLENIYQNSIYKNHTTQLEIQEQSFVFPQILNEKVVVDKLSKELNTKETAVKKDLLTETVVKDRVVKESAHSFQTEVLKIWTHTLAGNEIYRETQKILDKQFVKAGKEVLNREYLKLLSGETVNNFWNSRTDNISQVIQNGTTMLINNVLQKSWYGNPVKNINEISHVQYQSISSDLHYYEENVLNHAEQQSLQNQQVVQNQQAIQNQQVVQNQQSVQNQQVIQNHQDIQNHQMIQNHQQNYHLTTQHFVQNVLQNQKNQLQQITQQRSANESSNIRFQNVTQELNYHEGDLIQNQENHYNDQEHQDIQNQQNIQTFETELLNQYHKTEHLLQEAANRQTEQMTQNVLNQQITQQAQNVLNQQAAVLEQKIWNVETLQKNQQNVQNQQNIQENQSIQQKMLIENIGEIANVQFQNISQELNYYEGDSAGNQEIQNNVQQMIQNQQNVQNQQMIQNQQNVQNQQMIQSQQSIQNQQIVQKAEMEYLTQNVFQEQTKQLQQEVWNVETLHKHQKVQLQQLEKNNLTMIQQMETDSEVSNAYDQNRSPQFNYHEGDVTQKQEYQFNQELLYQNQNIQELIRENQLSQEVMHQHQVQQNLIHQGETINHSQNQMLQQLVKKDLHLNVQTLQHIRNNYPLLNNEKVQKEFITQKLKNIQKSTEQVPGIEPTQIIYNEETDRNPAKKEQLMQLQKQVDEVVRELKSVEEKTIVRKKEATAQQREIVKEVLTTNTTVWTEGMGQEMIQREVQRSLEQGMPESIDRIATKVYRRLEEKLKMERGRRGMN